MCYFPKLSVRSKNCRGIVPLFFLVESRSPLPRSKERVPQISLKIRTYIIDLPVDFTSSPGPVEVSAKHTSRTVKGGVGAARHMREGTGRKKTSYASQGMIGRRTVG